MSTRTRTILQALGLMAAGIAFAAALTVLTTHIASPRIGLDESPSLGELAPVPARDEMPGTAVSTAHPDTAGPATTNAQPATTPPPTATAGPHEDDDSRPGADEEDRSGRGRGRGRGRGDDD